MPRLSACQDFLRVRRTARCPHLTTRSSLLVALLLAFFSVAAQTVVAPEVSARAAFTVTVHNSLTDAPWWHGLDCDTGGYSGAYPIAQVTDSASPAYGLLACGPRPYWDNAPDRAVSFSPAIGSPSTTWQVNEWECTELSFRYMYLAWGVNPYPGNGNTLAANYASNKSAYNPSGPDLQYTAYTPGEHVIPQAGDVLSTYNGTSAGHTAVVVESSVNSSGNGSITLVQQNWEYTNQFIDTYSISNWTIEYYAGYDKSWLHNPDSPRHVSTNPPTPSGTSLCTSVTGPNLTSFCDVPSVTITCGGPVGSTTDYSGVPINWTNTNGGTVCDKITYTFGYNDARNDCSYYFYAPNGYATTTIHATLSDGSQELLDENPVDGWQYWFDAVGITSLYFVDGNGSTNQKMGWGDTSSYSIERVCSL